MKIHEYQAKEILMNYGIPVQGGDVVEDEASIEKVTDALLKKYNSKNLVVKAQIHAGGRGKGGGVKFSVGRDKIIENTKAILGMNLVTPQTGAEGRIVKKVMLAEAIDIAREYYVAITLDRSISKNVFIVSQSGGMDIEHVAATEPEKITKISIDPNYKGLPRYAALNLCMALGFDSSKELTKLASNIFIALYKCFLETDASIVEVNPLVLTDANTLLALDAKFNFDDNAMYRHKGLLELRDLNEEEESEIEAAKYNLNFIKLSGKVGCMVNGAGLAMATMDIIKLMGGEPANFLDVGGTASVETVKNALRIILSDKEVEVVLINIFGGIVRCDRVAGGIIEAVKELKLDVPIVVRLAGTNAEVAKKMLDESSLAIIPASTFDEAAKKAVEQVKS